MLVRFPRFVVACLPVAFITLVSGAETARADDTAALAPTTTLLSAPLSADAGPRVALLPSVARSDEAGPRRPTRMNSRALFGTGVAFSTIGTAGLVLGGVFYANMKSGEAARDRFSQRCPVCGAAPTTGVAVNSFGAITSFVGGGVFTAVGIPMTVVGSLRKPLEAAEPPAPPAPRAEVSIGAARASMTVHF